MTTTTKLKLAAAIAAYAAFVMFAAVALTQRHQPGVAPCGSDAECALLCRPSDRDCDGGPR